MSGRGGGTPVCVQMSIFEPTMQTINAIIGTLSHRNIPYQCYLSVGNKTTDCCLEIVMPVLFHPRPSASSADKPSFSRFCPRISKTIRTISTECVGRVPPRASLPIASLIGGKIFLTTRAGLDTFQAVRLDANPGSLLSRTKFRNDIPTFATRP